MTNENSQESSALFIGQILKSSRIEQGLSLEAIAKKLRISKRQLVQLEEDHENLVCDVYTLGFLRSYARCLGLDEHDMSQKFKDQACHPKSFTPNFPAPLPGKGRPSFRVLGLCLVAVLIVIGGWRWFGSSLLAPASQGTTNLTEFVQKKDAEIKAPLPPETSSPIQEVSSPLKEEAIEPVADQPAPLPPETSSPIQEVSSPLKEEAIEPVADQPAPLPSEPSSPMQEISSPLKEEAIEPVAVEPSSLPPLPSQSAVIIKATEETWIEIKNKNGTIILSKLFAPNETFKIQDPQNLILRTGNARGTQLIFGNQTRTLSDKPGEVKSNVLLDPQKWVEESPKTE
jgi:cytoskeleton protein RodZ